MFSSIELLFGPGSIYLSTATRRGVGGSERGAPRVTYSKFFPLSLSQLFYNHSPHTRHIARQSSSKQAELCERQVHKVHEVFRCAQAWSLVSREAIQPYPHFE